MKTIYGKTETRYILETDASTVSTGNIASVEKPLGELQKRQSVSVPVTQKPRQGPLRPQTGGGAHRDKKKEQKQGKEKHRKPFAEEDVAETKKKPNATTRHLRDYPVSDKDVAKPVKKPEKKKPEQGVAEGFDNDPTGPATWNGHRVVANRRTPKGGFLILQNKNDGKYEIHKQNPGVVGGLEFVSVHKTPDEMQSAFKKLTGIDESNQGVAEGGLEPDHEISMASSELKSIATDARQLLMLLKKYSEAEGLQAWQQSKITKAADYMTSVLRSINNDQNPLEGRYGRSSWDSSMPSWQDREQRAMDADKRAFKYAELQHELGHEEEPYRPQRRYSSPASSGMYFYNVKPGQENDAYRAGLKQTKSGKWYSKNSNQEADKIFGPGRFWQPKSESVAEEKQKGVDGKACWKGYKRMGTKKKGGRTVDNCVKVGEDTYTEHLFSTLDEIVNEKAPPGDKYERMVKHIKKGYSKDGKLTDVETRKAYGAAWKAKNKSKK